MGKPACSFRHRLIALAAAGLMACGFLPVASAFADDAQDDFVAASLVGAESEGSAEGATTNSILASTLTSDGVSVISADVLLSDEAASDAIIGSFTANGLTFALNSDDGVILVAVSPDVILSEAAIGSEVEGSLSIPQTITYNGVTYPVTAIGPYAFYLSGATQVALPTSIITVDDRAFRSSDVGCVEVNVDNPNITSFDGALYSVDLSRLLLIPEGRKGSVLLSCETEVVEASLFSHCSLVDAISVEEGGAAFSSWDGLLYSADSTTLLRVPAGATEITIREGCTTIAAGAMEGCAKLERINAPSTVTSISPNVFESVPTISLPVMTLQDESVAASFDAERSEASPFRDVGAESEESAEGATPNSVILSEGEAGVEESPQQITAMVALGSVKDNVPEANPAIIAVALPTYGDKVPWEGLFFEVRETQHRNQDINLGEATSYNACSYTTRLIAVLHNASNSTIYFGSDWVHSVSNPSSFCFTGPCNNRLEPGKTLSIYDVTCNDYVNPVLLYYDATYGFWHKWINYESNHEWCTRQYAFSLEEGGRQSIAPTFFDASGSPVSFGQFRNNECQDWYFESINGVKIWDYSYDVSFDTDSEPGDEDYPGDAKPDETIGVGDGQVEIEDPKRPGYVFQGWVIPDAETGNKEALDQDLVYQGDDGKWYVDASKLPNYASEDNRVELTARWTSIISVDVPSAVTFYADVVTQGNESREGAVSSAFGQSKVSNQSQVDLRVVGLESEAVETTESTLGADSILKKAAAATPATSASKLLSLYPSTKAWTAEELQDPDAVGDAKATTAVDFDLDDLLLEASFSADDFTIPAGDTLNMGYRLNLSETGQELDYGKLSTLEDGQSAAIANVSYCFAADMRTPIRPSGTEETKETDPLWFELDEDLFIEDGSQLIAQKGIYKLSDIKQAANSLSTLGEQSNYYDLFEYLRDTGHSMYAKGADGAYLEMHVIGLCQDNKTSGGNAGLTLQSRRVLKNMPMNADVDSNPGYGGWALPQPLRTEIQRLFDSELLSSTEEVTKYQQKAGGTSSTYLQRSNERIFLPNVYEVFGTVSSTRTDSEAFLPTAYKFQYQWYKAGNQKKLMNTEGTVAVQYWLRSAQSTNARGFCLVTAAGALNTTATTNTNGVAPCFCL